MNDGKKIKKSEKKTYTAHKALKKTQERENQVFMRWVLWMYGTIRSLCEGRRSHMSVEGWRRVLKQCKRKKGVDQCGEKQDDEVKDPKHT